jgi:hypothetical protein
MKARPIKKREGYKFYACHSDKTFLGKVKSNMIFSNFNFDIYKWNKSCGSICGSCYEISEKELKDIFGNVEI